jgi:uncharacterized membrane protein (DUF485 family)
MFDEILKWGNNLVSYILLGMIAFLISFVVIWLTHFLSKKKSHSLIRGIIIGVFVAVVVFIINNITIGFMQNRGDEIKPKNQDIETLTLTAQKLNLKYVIDEEKDSFHFVLDDNIIEAENWNRSLKRQLSLYKELKTVTIENASNIPYNIVVELNEIDLQYEDIIFDGLTISEDIDELKEIIFEYDKNEDNYTLNGDVVDITNFVEDFKDKIDRYDKLEKVIIRNPENISNYVKDKLRILERMYTSNLDFIW